MGSIMGKLYVQAFVTVQRLIEVSIGRKRESSFENFCKRGGVGLEPVFSHFKTNFNLHLF